MKNYIANNLWVIARYSFGFLTGFLTSVLFTRIGGVELYGRYQYVLSVAGVFSAASLPGLNLASIKSVANNSSKEVFKAVKISFFGSLAGAALLACYAFIKHSDSSLLPGLYVASIFFPFYYSFNSWYVLYEGKFLFKEAGLRVIISGFFTALFLALGIFFGLSIEGLIGIYFGVASFFGAYYLLEVKRNIGSNVKEKLDLKLGLKMTFQKFSLSLVDNLPVLIMVHFFTFATVAIYQVSILWLNSILGLLAALSATYLPKLFRKNQELKVDLKIQIVIACSLWIILIIISRLVFLPIYGLKLKEGLRLLTWLSPVILIYPIKTYLVSVLITKGDIMYTTLVQMVSIILSASAFWWAKSWGFIAASVIYYYSINLLIILFAVLRNRFIKNRLNFLRGE